LHGPLQLVTKPLTVLILDAEEAATQDSLDRAEARFTQSGSEVYRLRTSDFGLADLTPAATVASLIYVLYPTIKMLQSPWVSTLTPLIHWPRLR
jgi:glucosamine--fructose-6-phosphate aminotransferase (isomerizing)